MDILNSEGGQGGAAPSISLKGPGKGGGVLGIIVKAGDMVWLSEALVFHTYRGSPFTVVGKRALVS